MINNNIMTDKEMFTSIMSAVLNGLSRSFYEREDNADFTIHDIAEDDVRIAKEYAVQAIAAWKELEV